MVLMTPASMSALQQEVFHQIGGRGFAVCTRNPDYIQFFRRVAKKPG